MALGVLLNMHSVTDGCEEDERSEEASVSFGRYLRSDCSYRLPIVVQKDCDLAMPLRLTGQQLAVMRLLWDCGELTVADVQERLHSSPKPAYSTVATILGRLEKRGLIQHRQEDRTYFYSAAVSETGVVKDFVDRIFGGSTSELVSHLLDSRDLPLSELDRIKQLIHDYEKTRKPLKGKSRK